MTGLSAAVRTGTAWSLANTVVVRLGTFLTGVVFARLLTPADYGVYAAALVALMVLLSMNELGVSLAIVRWDGDVRRFAPTVLSIALAVSVALYAVLFAIAPWFAAALRAPEAAGVLRLLCVSVVLDALACVSAGLLNRAFEQKKRFVVDVLNFAVGSVVTLILALAGAGAWSLAWGAVAGNAVALVGFAVAAPCRILPGWDREQAKALVRYGLPLAGSSLLVLAMLNVDYVVVGATLGPAALGFYLLAFNMSSWPVKTISEAVRRVSFAGFSSIERERGGSAEALQRALTVLLAGAVPACVLLAILSEPLIRFVYGQTWVPAAPVLTFLALLGLLRIVYELAYDYLVAAGRSRTLIAVHGWWLVALLPALVVGARLGGIAAVGLCHVLVAGLLVLPVFLRALGTAGVSARAMASACKRPLTGGALMALVVWAVVNVAGGGLLAATIASALGLLVYLPVVAPLRSLLRPDSSAVRS